MIDAMRIGLNGMRVAEVQFAARSRNIVNVATPGYRPVEPVIKGGENGPTAIMREKQLVPGLGAVQEANAAYGVSLPEELVRLRVAEHAYKASAKVVAAAGRMTRETIELIG